MAVADPPAPPNLGSTHTPMNGIQSLMAVLLACFLLAVLILLLLKLYDRLFSLLPNPNPTPSLIPITHHREECLTQREMMRIKKVTENCTECAICFEGFTDDDGDRDSNKKKIAVRVLPECGHKFHERCLTPWLSICRSQPTCPKCRCPLKPHDDFTTHHHHHHQIEITMPPEHTRSTVPLPHEIMMTRGPLFTTPVRTYSAQE
ncbi:hypothetical protein Cgig2_004912 [Carnegiea gigantea]|uniref:RING-type domain-containing protein n=1 Tax=Carnegiea gigantea TaxID=171969 RepID=A0A9Q1KXE1_9CARY|nr:hypothetical protein Cgig2_004912 [Carnegiea gigantea]